MKSIKSWNNISLTELEHLAQTMKGLLKTPSVIVLSGEVGAGKTTFVKYFAGQLDICSPTYSLITEYDDLVHADLYRIGGPGDLIHLELELYEEDKDYFFIEWGKDYSSHLRTLLGEHFHYYELAIFAQSDPNLRTFSLSEFI